MAEPELASKGPRKRHQAHSKLWASKSAANEVSREDLAFHPLVRQGVLGLYSGPGV